MCTFHAAQVAQLRVAALGGGNVRPVQRAQASKPCYDLRSMHRGTWLHAPHCSMQRWQAMWLMLVGGFSDVTLLDRVSRTVY